MSDFELEHVGDGRFALRGAMTFSTVADILARSKELFGEHSGIEIDFEGVARSDSAGLALLLEWVNWAKRNVREIKYEHIPKQILAMAQISELEDMLYAGERWTGERPRASPGKTRQQRESPPVVARPEPSPEPD